MYTLRSNFESGFTYMFYIYIFFPKHIFFFDVNRKRKRENNIII